VKQWDPKRGWLIECRGGPMKGQWIRAYNMDSKTKEETPFDMVFTVIGNTDGHYCLQPLHKRDGERKMARRNKQDVPDWYYQWVPEEET